MLLKLKTDMNRRNKKSKPPDVQVTQHAIERARERLSFNAQVLLKMARRAFFCGIAYEDTRGALHNFLDKYWDAQTKGNHVRIYGEVIYVFAKNKLLTVYQIPCKVRRILRILTVQN
jgi:hypothetical protein